MNDMNTSTTGSLRRVLFLLTAAAVASTLVACGKGGSAAPEKAASSAAAGEKGEGKEGGGLKLSAEEAQRAGLKLETLASLAFADSIAVTATIRPNQDRIARVAPRVEGRIVSVAANLGDAVKAVAANAVGLGKGTRQGVTARHRWQIGEKSLIEIPVTTLPVFKTPIHASYVIYLSTFSKVLARSYWKAAVEMCRATGTQLSLLLHPLDFLSGEDAPELKFFPAMNLPIEKKLEFVSEILESFTDKFEVVNMRRHAQSVNGKTPVKQILTADAW